MAGRVYWCTVTMLLSGLLTGTASRSVRQRRSWFTGWKTDTEKSGFTSEEEKAIVEIHNELRLRVNASDMRQQSWDPSLATDAQSWADGCDYASDNRTSYGENLAAQPLHFHETKTVENWYSEGQHYVYSNNSCTQVCEHYTQVVLAESSRLGCGIKYCSNFTTLTLSDAYFIVCYYDQAYNNSRVPYREGAVCSSCPSDAPICDNSFCRQRNMNDTTTTEITTETTTTSTTTSIPRAKTTVTTMSSSGASTSTASSSTVTTNMAIVVNGTGTTNTSDCGVNGTGTTNTSDCGACSSYSENATITNSRTTTSSTSHSGVTRGRAASAKLKSSAMTSCFSVISLCFSWMLSRH